MHEQTAPTTSPFIGTAASLTSRKSGPNAHPPFPPTPLSQQTPEVTVHTPNPPFPPQINLTEAISCNRRRWPRGTYCTHWLQAINWLCFCLPRLGVVHGCSVLNVFTRLSLKNGPLIIKRKLILIPTNCFGSRTVWKFRPNIHNRRAVTDFFTLMSCSLLHPYLGSPPPFSKSLTNQTHK